MTKYTNLHLTSLTTEQHERTCNYWYLVTALAMPHTAFTTQAALENWMTERNLKVNEPIPAQGTWSSQKIVGEYADAMLMDTEAFNNLAPIIVSRTLSNAYWVEAKITDDNGFRTVYTLNPNVHTRRTFDPKECRDLYQ